MGISPRPSWVIVVSYELNGLLATPYSNRSLSQSNLKIFIKLKKKSLYWWFTWFKISLPFLRYSTDESSMVVTFFFRSIEKILIWRFTFHNITFSYDSFTYSSGNFPEIYSSTTHSPYTLSPHTNNPFPLPPRFSTWNFRKYLTEISNMIDMILLVIIHLLIITCVCKDDMY